MARLANNRVWDSEVALRLRVSHMLGTTDFEPRGLPPSATLLVRRLPDPLPGRLMPDANAIRSSPEWERALLLSLEDFYRRAARPALEFVPAGAASVLFLDEGEMLACLALDLMNGDARARWWWTTMLRRLPSGAAEALLAAWRGKPQYIPAAFRHLALRQQAVRVVEALSSVEAWSLLADVAREFELRLPTRASAAEFVPVPVAGDAPRAREQFHHAPPAAFDSVREIVPPWAPLVAVDAVPYSLGREHAALLGISLLLQRAPQIARSAAFAGSFARWYEAKAHAQHRPNSLAEHDAPSRAAIGTEAHSLLSPASAETVASPQLSPHVALPEATEAAADESVATKLQRKPESGSPPGVMEISASLPTQAIHADRKNSHSHDVVEWPGSPIEDVDLSRDNIQRHAETITLLPTVVPKPSSAAVEKLEATQTSASREASPIEESPAAHLAQDAIETELGGVLFLINLVRALGLHSFLGKLGLGDQLSDWALVELLARCLVGRRHAHLAADPIWLALAKLDGRDPAVAAGSDFRGCERYTLPPSWTSFLAGSESRTLGVRLRNRHLQIWHRQGFLLVDSVFEGSATHDAIRRQLSSYFEDYELMTRAALCGVLKKTCLAGCDPLSLEPGRELRRFLAFLLPYVRWRLASNLGLNSTGSSAIADVLLLRSAHAYITSTHIDVVMSMNQASGPVRLAGLDADPGWVPSFGRVVKFHFT